MTKQLNIRMNENETYESGPKPTYALGTRGYAPDGRVYRYARNSTVALAVGRLTRRTEKTLGHSNLSVAVAVLPGAGAITVALTFDGISSSEYQDGLLYVNDALGQGDVYGITGTDSQGTASTATIHLTLRLRNALTTSSQVSIIKNRYQGVRITEAMANVRALGATPMAVSANDYFWAQVAGPAALLQDGAWDENKDLVPSDQVRGAVMAASSVSQGAETRLTDVGHTDRQVLSNVIPFTPVTNIIGYALDPRADTEHGLVHLSLDV